jgi:hypothetical protein
MVELRTQSALVGFMMMLPSLTILTTVMPAVYSQQSDLPSVLENAQKSVKSKNPNVYVEQNITMPPVNYTQIFSENKYFQSCSPPIAGLPECLPAIDVLYQDNSTVALSSDHIDIIWRAVAEIKKSGYEIDAMTSYPITAPHLGNYVNILVVMSR